MIVSISMTKDQLGLIDRLRKKTGETRSAFLVRKAGGIDAPPSKRQLAEIAKRVRAAIMG